MPAPDKIKQLVETFEQNLNEYHTRKNLAPAKTPQEKESVQRQVQSTDGAIDKLVYELSPEGDNNMG